MKNRVREFRKANNMTQEELANLVFVSSRTIISLEKEKYNPSLMLAYKISLLFNTTVEELYCLEENIKSEKENL